MFRRRGRATFDARTCQSATAQSRWPGLHLSVVALSILLAASGCSSSSGGHASPKAASTSASAKPAAAAAAARNYVVGSVTQTFVDDSRKTPAHLGVAGQPSRTLITTIWYPAVGKAGSAPVNGAAPDRSNGPYPLVVFAHGLSASPQYYSTLLSRWAAAGFVVAAPLFPLTHAGTPGGLDQDDQFNQPADIRFVITSVLAATRQPGNSLHGLLSATEVGVAGHSDGAVTTLAFLNTCCSDSRVGAVEVLSGDPEAYPNGRYKTKGNPPTLIVHGTLDPLLSYNQQVSFFNALTGPKAFLDLKGADHTDFLTPGKWFNSFINTTIDFWRAQLQGSHVAAARLTSDAQPGITAVYTSLAGGSSVHAPLLPEPKTNRRASISPNKNLRGGQTITVSWSGYLPTKVVNIVECSSTTQTGCDVAAGRVLIPDTPGKGSITLTIVEGKVGDGTCDATHSGCQIVVNDAGLEDPAASIRIPISFASG
jgi:fermentation-respiration switch protein FrsA (DUF1100 family)